MLIATVVVSVLLAAAVTGSAAAKLTHVRPVIETVTAVGFPEERIPVLAALELAAAAGLLIGLRWAPLGVAAAAGVIVYFAGALPFHFRAGDRNIAGPAALLLLASPPSSCAWRPPGE